MTHALVAFLLIIGLSPMADTAEAIRPEVNGVSKELIAGPPDLGPIDLAGGITHRCGARNALEDIVAAIALGIGADGGQKPWGQHLFGPPGRLPKRS